MGQGDRALVLRAAFASLRWGEAIALRRCDLDLDAGTVRIHAALTERSNGEIVIGPPKLKAGRRIVGIPARSSRLCSTCRSSPPLILPRWSFPAPRAGH